MGSRRRWSSRWRWPTSSSRPASSSPCCSNICAGSRTSRSTGSRSTGSKRRRSPLPRGAAVASLFKGGIDPMVVIRWRDIFLNIKRAIDATETAATVVEGHRDEEPLEAPGRAARPRRGWLHRDLALDEKRLLRSCMPLRRVLPRRRLAQRCWQSRRVARCMESAGFPWALLLFDDQSWSHGAYETPTINPSLDRSRATVWPHGSWRAGCRSSKPARLSSSQPAATASASSTSNSTLACGNGQLRRPRWCAEARFRSLG